MSARWRGFLDFAINVFAINDFGAGDSTIHDRKTGDRAQPGRRWCCAESLALTLLWFLIFWPFVPTLIFSLLLSQ